MKIDPIWQAEIQQRVFRLLLEAFSRPGTIQDMSGLIAVQHASIAVLAAMLDRQATLADPHKLLEEQVWPLLQARPDGVASAGFILADGAVAPDFEPCLGTLGSPELGATLVLRAGKITAGKHILLRGPGVDGSAEFSAAGIEPVWLDKRKQWSAAFPLGVDIVLADATAIVAIPRSVQMIFSGGTA